MAKKKTTPVDNIIDYQATFNTPAGKRVLLDLMKFGHVLSSIFVSGKPDELAFREGERNAVLRILYKLKQDPESILKLIEEGESNE